MLNKPLAILALFALVFAILCPPSLACNTPVYRYAMYNWQTAPYIAFYFYEGEIPQEDKDVHEALEKLTEEWPPEANIRLEPIDVSDAKKLEILPEFVIDAWKSHEDGKTPAYVIYSPLRAHIYSGQLDQESARKLIDSPARQKFGQLLEEGNAAVMILLTCPDEEQNKKAEEALKGLRKLADSGEIPIELQLPPMGLPEDGEEADEDAPDPNKLGISVLKVNRDDPAEEFFVRMLMSIEDDLQEYADQPMIFAGYGRGRAMEPYIGKGITAENLVDVVAFLAGACSCMVKEQNPGADLLLKWNWEETADKMAENDPTLDYGPYGPQGYGEFPADSATAENEAKESDDAVASDAPADNAEEDADKPAADVVAMSDAAPTTDLPSSDSSSVTEDDELAEGAKPSIAAEEDSPEPTASQTHTVAEDSSTQGPSQPGSFSSNRMFTYGLGFGAIAIGVILAGLALVLRRS